MDNSLVLSEELEENAMQTLIGIAIEDLFPEPCDKWHAMNQETCARYKEELVKRKDIVHQEIARGEDSLWHVLHKVIVTDVMRLFLFVSLNGVSCGTMITHLLCSSLEHDELSPRVEDSTDSNANPEAAGRVFL